jgi:hypothetical protein
MAKISDWQYLPKHRELIDIRPAPYRLSAGGVFSGKTATALMYGVRNYILPYPGCNMLVVRRTLTELKTGAIADLREFCDDENGKLYQYNSSDHIAKFFNGSQIIFAHCVHNLESDLKKYLGQKYPYILPDELAQFSPDTWEMFVSRNGVNPECKPDDNGTLPHPGIWGTTNPIGPYWLFYKSMFVDKRPYPLPEGAWRDNAGAWWVGKIPDCRCIYDPRNYSFSHSTVLDNPEYLKRDPTFVSRLNMLSKAKREKMLLGLLDRVEGQYYDVFSEEHHVVKLRENPEAVVWQDHQPVWGGWDWGKTHYNTFYLFTRALVKSEMTGEFKLKTVCFREIVTQGLDGAAMVALVAKAAKHPQTGAKLRVSAIYFSHEKFVRDIEQHSPADAISKLLRAEGLPAVTPATRDRVGRASFLYGELQANNIVFLDSCEEIVNAIPTLQTDPDHLDDVLKVDGKPDDCYDGFTYGLFGQLGDRKKSREQEQREQIDAIKDPLAKRLVMLKHTLDREKQVTMTHHDWQTRLQ